MTLPPEMKTVLLTKVPPRISLEKQVLNEETMFL